ncbi:MAG: GNAT family N-acetyltransferase [Anaerolineales bacterium]|nr:MAG: GNAT family N-acetyltransferase [Anaerolineales bacterium]
MTNIITLRDVTQDDLPILFEHQLDPQAAKMAAFPSRDWDAFTAHWTKIMANEKVITKTILLDGQVAGSLACFEMDEKLEVGYWIGREFWGMGIASESLRQFLGQVSMRPLHAHVARHNIASQRVLQKCGFEVSGEDKWTPSPEIGEIEELIFLLR